jgi:hypothetical protein
MLALLVARFQNHEGDNLREVEPKLPHFGRVDVVSEPLGEQRERKTDFSFRLQPYEQLRHVREKIEFVGHVGALGLHALEEGRVGHHYIDLRAAYSLGGRCRFVGRFTTGARRIEGVGVIWIRRLPGHQPIFRSTLP